MGYTPENNPYIPGDPYSYDLKWMVSDIKQMEQRFGELDDSVQEATDQADRSEREADRSRDEADRSNDEALVSEGYATGEQDGVPVTDPDSPYYENNAKYYADDAQLRGNAEALKAEGHATGTQDGVPVSSGSPYYENNSKYYSEQSADSAQEAADYAAHIADPVSGLVTDWLADHITQPTVPAIDTSLTVAGAAADAKVTGDWLRDLDARTYTPENIYLTGTALAGITTFNPTGISTYSGLAKSYQYDVTGLDGKTLKISGQSSNVGGGSNYSLAAIYDSSMNRLDYIGTTPHTSYTDEDFIVPSGAATLYVNFADDVVRQQYYIAAVQIGGEVATLQTKVAALEADSTTIHDSIDYIKNNYIEGTSIGGVTAFNPTGISTYTSGDCYQYDVSGLVGKTLKINGTSGNVGGGAAYFLAAIYDSSMNRLDYVGSTAYTSYVDEDFVVPSGAATLYVNFADNIFQDQYYIGQAIYSGIIESIEENFTNKKRILCFGDSLTMGAGGGGTTYPGKLADMLPNNCEVKNYGVGGEDAQQIAGRQGGVPLMVQPVTLPYNTWTIVTIKSLFGETLAPLFKQSGQGSSPMTLLGSPVSIYWDASDNIILRNDDSSVSNLHVKEPRPLIPYSATLKKSIDIFWMGANGGWNDIDELIAIHQRCIEYNAGEYIILGLYNDSLASQFADLEEAFTKAFGYHYINIREKMVNYGLSDMGITPTATDTTRIAQGLVPTSLMSDAIHLNASGYEYVAKCVLRRGWDLGFWK